MSPRVQSKRRRFANWQKKLRGRVLSDAALGFLGRASFHVVHSVEVGPFGTQRSASRAGAGR